MNKDFLAKSAPLFVAAATVVLLSISLEGCGKGKSIAGLDNFHADVVGTNLNVGFDAETIHLDIGVSQIPIPFLKGASLGITPDLSGKGTVFQFVVDLTQLFQNIHPGNLIGLPNGQPLPDVTVNNGELPAWPMKVGDTELQIYLSGDVFGIFVPMNFLSSLPAMLSEDVTDSRGNLLGRVYAIPADTGGEGSGLLMLLPFVGGGSSNNLSN
jgi:hypothetical protein